MRYRVTAIIYKYFQLLAKFTGTAAEIDRHEFFSRHFSAFHGVVHFLHFSGELVAQAPVRCRTPV
jgi:hypothetical protein